MTPASTVTRAALVAAAALALDSASIAYASDDATIEGTVVDLATGQPIGNAIAVDIACGAAHQHARVDGAGHFSFARLPDGACTLTMSAAGYVSTAAAVTAASGSIKTVLVRIATTAYAAQLREIQEEQARREREHPPMPTAPAPMVAHAAAHDAPPRAAPPPMQPVRLDPVRRDGDARRHIANRQAGEQLAVAQDADGWAAVRVFPVPQYTRPFDGPRTDFRETIYWNGDVETDGNGNADVAFAASDAVTAFRATAEGFAANGVPGRGEATFQAKLPLTLDAHLPVEVTAGDTVRLPVTLANDTDDDMTPALSAQFGSAFRLASPAPATLHLAARSKQTVVFPLEVVATAGDSDIDLSATAIGLTDEVKRTIRIVPRGFPIEVAASGTARRGMTARHVVDLAGALPGSIRATVTMFPSPVAMMTDGMAGMLREPGGCFEQTSSTNYPNVMVLSYLESNDAADPALVEKTRGLLDKGYKLLAGFETPEKGYEWFGRTPGHEALTAYGLMEFADMTKVYDVDRAMVDRTASWLMSRRDHHGGFARSSEALDSFGRADAAVTDAYIMWALAEAKRTGELTDELAAQRRLGLDTRDPYLLALATNTALVTAPNTADTRAMVDRLVGLQGKDGSFPGAQQTITMSGGESSTIETTALAVLALIHASPNGEHDNQLRAAVDWLNGKRRGLGQWSNTQATILGLKAMAAYADHTRVTTAGGTATLVVNGVDAGAIRFDAGRRDALVWNDLAGKLSAGNNTVELRLDSTTALPYAIAIDYRSARPASSARTKVAMTTELLATRVKMGDGVTLRAHVENTTQAGVPMTLARLGLPGGTVFQTWQLQELRDKGIIDYYETRPREVILYWRALAPGAKKDVDVKLLAAVPGTYEAPASSAYLYYTAEDKAWVAPLALAIE